MKLFEGMLFCKLKLSKNGSLQIVSREFPRISPREILCGSSFYVVGSLVNTINIVTLKLRIWREYNKALKNG